MMKALIVMAIATGFMGTAATAMAGVPSVPSARAPAGKSVGRHEGRMAPADDARDTSAPARQEASEPSIPGARTARSAALGEGAQMAILGGAILAAGIVFSATSHGNSRSTTPGTGGTTGNTGTTGTH